MLADALLSKRAYKLGYSVNEVYSMIKKSVGTQFDPELFPIFENMYHNEIFKNFYKGI